MSDSDAVEDAKRIIEEMRAEGLTPADHLEEFGHRNAIADLRRQATALGLDFSDHDVEQATMDQGTVVLRVVIGETNLFSAYRVDDNSISFTVPKQFASIPATEERPRWLH